MNSLPQATSAAERYDQVLRHAHNHRLPPEAPRPLPTRYWPMENVELLERYRTWLLGGGASEQCTDTIYLPFAGHVLGFNLKPHGEIDLEQDLERVMEYARTKGSGKDWLKNCRNSLAKFRRFLRLERGLGEVQKVQPFDVAQHTQGLPAWLVNELERFQHLQQRNWRTARVEAGIHRFWSTHLNLWRFLCGERQIVHLSDLKRQHILDYVDFRLNAGRSASSVNTELRTLLGFLSFLQGEGYPIPQALLRIPCLKVPDPLPKYLTDEQVRLLRDHFEERVAGARLPHQYRGALLGRVIFYLLWQCGMRVSEVEELRLEDLDLGARRIMIRDGKGRKDRTVYATDTTIRAVQEYLALRGSGSGDHVFLFRNAPLSHCFINSRIKNAGKRVGVKAYPHRLRHTTATQLLNAGCRVTSIQKFLGHKRLNTTMIYARALDQTVAEDYFRAMETIEQKLALPSNSSPKAYSPQEVMTLVDVLGTTNLNPAQTEIIRELRLSLSHLLLPELVPEG